jgi:hypothetical protein
MSHLDPSGARRSDRLSTNAATPSQPPTPIRPRPTNTITNDNDNPPSNSVPPQSAPPPPSTYTHANIDDDIDLSYHSTQASDDPPDTFPTHSLPSTQHTSTNSNPLQLQSLLQLLTTRLDNIEQTNNARMDSFENQLLQSHSTFQSQLLQSQTSLAKIIQSSLQPTAPTQPPPSIPPPTKSIQPTSKPPPISSDPPTSIPHSLPTRPKPTSPDPPESIPPSYPLKSSHYTTPNHRPPSKPNPTTHQHQQSSNLQPPSDIPPLNEQQFYDTHSPSPPPHPRFQSTHTTIPSPSPSQPPQTIIVQAPSTTPKLIIDSYKPKNGYLYFKNITLLNLSADPNYSNTTTYDTTGHLIFNTNMPMAFSRSLFCATLKALGSHASEIVSTTSDVEADAIKLWTRLDHHFLRTTSSHILKTKLKKEFETLKKESSDSFSGYVSKFENALQQLKHNNISHGSSADIAYRFIESLSMPNIFNTILMSIDDDSTWALGHDLRRLAYKAEDHYLKHQQIYSTPCPAPSPSPAPSNPQHRNRPPRNQHPTPPHPTNPSPSPTHQPRPSMPAPSPPPSNPPNPRPPSAYIRNESEIQRIRALLQSPQDHTSTLHRLHQQYSSTCPLHSGAPHPIIDCAILRNICNQTNQFHTLNNTRNDYNLPPMPSTGLLAFPPRSRPSNTPPPPAQPQAPRPIANPYRTTPPGFAQPPPTQVPPPLQTAARHVSTPFYHGNPSLYVPEDIPPPATHDPLDNDDTACPPCLEPQETNVDDNNFNNPPQPYSLPSILKSPSTPRRASNSVSFHPDSFPSLPLATCRHVPTPTTSAPLSSFTRSSSSYIRAVCDSGASHSMTSHLDLFSSITYFSSTSPTPKALMGDDTTALPIEGYGYIDYIVHNHRIRHFAYYVPLLGTTLISIKQHMSYQGCYFHAEAQSTVLAFPNFLLYPRVSEITEWSSG